MFEMIGILVGAIILFVLSVVAGSIYAGLAFLFLWKRPRRRVSLTLLAAAIPVCSAAYMWLCVATLPTESLFGDINQPLPNGYILKALGKMPEYGMIERGNGDLLPDGVNGDVDMIAVNGPLVAGRYCQSCNQAFVQSKAQYFVLDTRNSKSSEYPNLPSLEASFGRIPLVENQFFRSQEHSYVRQQRLNQFIMFTPPALLTIALVILLIRARLSQPPIES